MSGLNLPLLSFQSLDEQILDLVSRPRGFSEEFQGGFDGGIVGETAYPDAIREFVPAVFLDETLYDDLQGVAVQRIIGMRIHGYGNSRILRLRKRMGEPSDSRQRWPLLGEELFPPETSTPFTHRRISPLMART